MKYENKQIIRWILVLPVLVTLTLGWAYPLIGFIVPLTITVGLIVSVFRGRYICGNLCPRGSFLDKLIAPLNSSKDIPNVFLNPVFRWTVFFLLMGVMVYRISLDPTNITHWGRVFVMMCFVTTVIALMIAVIFPARTWCSFCPSGTMQMFVGKGKYQLLIKDSCIGCNLCTKSCPLKINISSYKATGRIENKDCLKCYKCIETCPRSAVERPRNSQLSI